MVLFVSRVRCFECVDALSAVSLFLFFRSHLSSDHLVGGRHDGIAYVLAELSLLHVVLGAALLEGGHATDDGEGHLQGERGGGGEG